MFETEDPPHFSKNEDHANPFLSKIRPTPEFPIFWGYFTCVLLTFGVFDRALSMEFIKICVVHRALSANIFTISVLDCGLTAKVESKIGEKMVWGRYILSAKSVKFRS